MSPAHHGRFVAYYRVSTDRQGIDGYGIAAQRKAVKDRLDGGGWQLVKEYTEVESGRRRSRPELLKALEACKKHRAKLVVARLDRLTRDTAFLLTLINSGIEPLFCNMPQIPGAMGKMVLTVMAACAELEAGLVSERTKAALAEAKRKGKRIGGANRKSAEIAAAAAERAAELRPIIDEIKAELPKASANQIAIALNNRRIPTPTGARWHAQSVIRVLQRLEMR
jgi:DNA invertase Pin-like site-specific DNA recombinase